MLKKSADYFAKVCIIAITRFFEEKYTYRTSALAFTTLLAIVPLLFVIVFFSAVFPLFNNIVALGETYILQNFVPESAVMIEKYFTVFLQQTTRLPTLTIIFLIIVTIALVHTIEETLNDIWKVPRRKRSKKALALLLYWLIFLLMPLVIGLSIFISSYIFLLSWMTNATVLPPFVLTFLPILINTLIFSVFYTIVPNVKVKLFDGLLGGFIAALLFEVARIGFAFYIAQFPGYSIIYGAFAVIPIFLVWLYVLWFIILFGALITYSWVSIRHARSHHHA